MRRFFGIVFALCSLASACAREAPDVRSPHEPLRPWVTPEDYAWPPRVNRDGLAHAPETPADVPAGHSTARRNRAPLRSDALLPGGSQCLERLRQDGVAFREVDRSRGVETPIVVNSISGIEFWSVAGPMLVDCRFALALVQVAPEFSALGIRRVRFSGAYVYRTSKTGRLSLHAYGLALDVHEVTTKSGTYSVKRDFARGLGESCGDEAPLLNRLACRLRAPGLFRELLTPDYDADHHDHLHLGVAPLPSSGDQPNAARPAQPKARRTMASVKVARR